MNHCRKCGGNVIYLTSGGCGGRGSLSGCEPCDIVYQQTNGGWLPSPGGPSYCIDELTTYKEIVLRLAKKIKPYHIDREGENHNKWAWCEVGFAPRQYFDSEAEAKSAIEKYIQKCDDALPNPLCDRCGKKSERFGAYSCADCYGFYYGIKTGWIYLEPDKTDKTGQQELFS